MKRLEVIKNLNDSIEHIDELIKASKGEKSLCGCTEFKEITLYVQTWIRSPLLTALREVEKEKGKLF